MGTPLTSLAVDHGALPVVDCAACGSRALVWLDVDDAGRDLERCLACNAPVDERRVRAAGERAIERMGYVFLDKKRKSKSAQKLSGCGAKGVKSCGTGGCSSGGCSTGGGGCSSGGCGSK